MSCPAAGSGCAWGSDGWTRSCGPPGADPRSRGRRTDETIAAMRTLWADSGPEGAHFDGEFFSFHHAHSFPKPARPGGVPIHIGGHSEAAARRAGRVGDGFQPLGLAAEDLVVAPGPGTPSRPTEAGRDPDAIELTLSGYLPTDDRAAGDRSRVGRGRPPGGLHVHDRGPGAGPRRDVGVCRAIRAPAPQVGGDRSGSLPTGRSDRTRWSSAPCRPATPPPSTVATAAMLAALFVADGALVVPGLPRRPPPGDHPARARRPPAGARRAPPLPADLPPAHQPPLRGGRGPCVRARCRASPTM